ncbi:MAG: RluA family pseudouridine synthase [Candidatus Paceibacterota bacterium]|jgi:23S rRNA pseudouridine1911/1915/1917 synthase
MKKFPPLKILYEDGDCVVINKPAGLIVHPAGSEETDKPSVAEWVTKKYPEARDVGEPIILSDKTEITRPGIVHRIDRDTSGALLIAKNPKAFKFFKKQFQNREVEKIYNAFVYGDMKYEDGIIEKPLAKSMTDFRKWTTSHNVRGEVRDALTAYRVLARGDGVTLIEARPKTGRTHQIRVHMKSIERPVVCDSLYASYEKPILGFKRLALHARAISFTSKKGQRIEVVAPYPKDFLSAMKKIGYKNKSSTK